jgi:hypothetical protein
VQTSEKGHRLFRQIQMTLRREATINPTIMSCAYPQEPSLLLKLDFSEYVGAILHPGAAKFYTCGGKILQWRRSDLTITDASIVKQ